MTNNQLTEKQVTQGIASRIEEKKISGGFVVPPNYGLGNALSSAYYELQNSSSGNLLEQCTSDSIYISLLDMVAQGLSPSKKQCYFIKYGNKVQLRRSYFGTMKVVLQLSEVKEIWAGVIYEGDTFITKNEKGRMVLVSHDTTWKNQDNPIEGAYCIIERVDGEQFLTVMTKKQIDKAWSKAKTKNVQIDFPDQMAMRTVINRAAKPFINTSDDSSYFIEALNRTTENEYENDRKIKEAEVIDDTTTSLDDILGQPQSEKAEVVEVTEEPEKPTKPKDITPDVAQEKSTEYPAEEVPDFTEETSDDPENEQTALFDQLGDLM